MNAPAARYIWITRWQEFQHYPPRRDRGPAWIKDYTAQLDDERYLKLTDTQRCLLHDLRLMFALYRGWLTLDLKMINARLGLRAKIATVEALNHAGFIEYISRATLEARLEKLYASRAPARSQEEEKETDEERGFTNSESLPKEARPEGAYAQELSRLATTVTNGEMNGNHPEPDEPYFARLLVAVGDTEENFTKLRRASRGKPIAATIAALEAALAPTTRDPLAVALTVLSDYSAT